MVKTTIQIEMETRLRLKKFKIVKSESYEDQLNRIMNKLEELKEYNSEIFAEEK